MFFHWLKRYLPRGLYTRAALILILPVVTLQLVISIVFIQRHFEGVTRQMTQTATREVRLLLDAIPPDIPADQIPAALAHFADPLEIPIHPPGVQLGVQPDERRWFDLSGIIVQYYFREMLPELLAVSLPNNDDVLLFLDIPQGILTLQLDRRRVSASNPHQLFVNMVFFGGLMTLIAFIYLRNQLRPITRLAAAAEAFGRGRNLPYKPSGAVEVRAAGNAFLDMRARIERQIEQRTLMLSGVSHDLRTPLTRLRLGLSMIDDPEAEDLLRDVDDMQRMLDEFLSFSRGSAEGEPEPTDPIALVRSLVDDAHRAGQDVTLTETTGGGTVTLRPVAIRRAVANLIENGVRYGGTVQISVALTDKSLRIRVEDNGPGIPPESREQAIKPFTRLDGARNQNRGSGVGLGLAIATDIARAHGGVLRLGESEALGGLRADLVIGR
ncbi:two-component system, OmpR family, osmolarity sensor histidine kinase EnvZ [Thalassovita litoralis]|uniref:histidine kinase n=1 Tax=Thalassovita litoralis TaxID=1010611 RepID=A0A521FQ79_9RHOB|nr:ATP-binding protein [Thalassovita litoralis]SMO97690.1 two-component system, OmpR family, osmolarity sensor histidine kinase EnvZ [Thalassovita litoralis]